MSVEDEIKQEIQSELDRIARATGYRAYDVRVSPVGPDRYGVRIYVDPMFINPGNIGRLATVSERIEASYGIELEEVVAPR